MPSNFMQQSFPADGNQPYCLSEYDEIPICDVALLDISNDGNPEILITWHNDLFIYTEDTSGWRLIGQAYGLSDETLSAFKAGRMSAERPNWDDLKINNTIVDIHTKGDIENEPPPAPHGNVTGF